MKHGFTICPLCEHLPDGASAKLCTKHECKACVVRYKSGQPGMCPACANERTLEELTFARAARKAKS